jgi:histidinol-phosphatase
VFDPATLAIALEVAVKAARAAATPIMEHFRGPDIEVESKGDGSPVCVADREAETLIRETLREAFPGIPINGEEQGHLGAKKTPLRWQVDPLDGTISYLRGLPLFGTVIGLEDQETGEALVGVIHLPALGETYAGAQGIGCFCNGQPVDVRMGVDTFPGLPQAGEDDPDLALQHIVLAGGDPLQFRLAAAAQDYTRLSESPLFRGYSDCFGHAMVLRGAVGVMVDPYLKTWDLAASRVLVREAKGDIFTRPSIVDGRVDAILGRADLVDHVARVLGWK